MDKSILLTPEKEACTQIAFNCIFWVFPQRQMGGLGTFGSRPLVLLHSAVSSICKKTSASTVAVPVQYWPLAASTFSCRTLCQSQIVDFISVVHIPQTPVCFPYYTVCQGSISNATAALIRQWFVFSFGSEKYKINGNQRPSIHISF